MRMYQAVLGNGGGTEVGGDVQQQPLGSEIKVLALILVCAVVVIILKTKRK